MKNIRFRKYDHLNSGFAYSHRLDGGSTTTFDFDMTYNSKKLDWFPPASVNAIYGGNR